MVFNNILVEQVKGSEEMKEKILTASRDMRLRPDYPPELQPEFFNHSICDKYLNNYHENHLHSNGNAIVSQCVFSFISKK